MHIIPHLGCVHPSRAAVPDHRFTQINKVTAGSTAISGRREIARNAQSDFAATKKTFLWGITREL